MYWVDWVVVAVADPVKVPSVMVPVIFGEKVSVPPGVATVSREAMELRRQ